MAGDQSLSPNTEGVAISAVPRSTSSASSPTSLDVYVPEVQVMILCLPAFCSSMTCLSFGVGITFPFPQKKKMRHKRKSPEKRGRRSRKSPDMNKRRNSIPKTSSPKGKVKPSPELLSYLKERPPLSEALIRHVVVENLELAEAGERVLEQQMGPPKNQFKFIPKPRAKLKSKVEVFAHELVD